MAVPFRNMLLSARYEPHQALNQLQVLFTQLTHTTRVAIEPRGVMSTCLPPWFTFGEQQDADELLRYFLDLMDRGKHLGTRGADEFFKGELMYQVFQYKILPTH